MMLVSRPLRCGMQAVTDEACMHICGLHKEQNLAKIIICLHMISVAMLQDLRIAVKACARLQPTHALLVSCDEDNGCYAGLFQLRFAEPDALLAKMAMTP